VSRIKRLLHLVFGEWNGVQNFIAPSVIGFLYDRVSFFKWIGSILTYQRYYLPIFFYIITLCIIAFCLLKAFTQWNNDNTKATKLIDRKVGKDLLLPLTIEMHKWLVLFLTAMMIVFVVKNAFNFIYRTNVPVFTLYNALFRFSLIILIVFLYAFLDFIIPVIRRGHSFEKATRYFYLYLIKRWKHVLPIYLVQILWIFISVLLFQIIIDYILLGMNYLVTNVIKKPLLINFSSVHNISQLVKNTIIIPVTFLISNVIYSPLVYILKKGFERFRITLRSS
jgi:hypothetical protein